MAGQHLLGQVVAATRQVNAQVLPKINELQRRANRVALRQRLGIAHPIQMQQQAPHGVGRALAVVQQLVVRAVVMRFGGVAHVLLKGVEQGVQQGRGQGVLCGLGGQWLKHLWPLGAGLALQRQLELLPKLGQGREAFLGGGVAFVGDVVGGAGKVVDGRNGRAQGRRAQPRGHRKVFVMIDALWVHATDYAHQTVYNVWFVVEHRCLKALRQQSTGRAGGEIGRRTRFRS